MAARSGGKKCVERCKYCWQVEGHNELCPIKIGSQRAMEVWQEGWEVGRMDKDNHPTFVVGPVSNPMSTWNLGYRIGALKRERLIEN